MINDKNTPISLLKAKVAEFVQERGWKKYHTPKNLIQAMQIELAELSELFLFRNISKEEICNNEKIYSDVKDEVADVFIYLLSFVNVLDIDISEAFEKKMKKNKNKYSISEFNDGRYYKK